MADAADEVEEVGAVGAGKADVETDAKEVGADDTDMLACCGCCCCCCGCRWFCFWAVIPDDKPGTARNDCEAPVEPTPPRLALPIDPIPKFSSRCWRG